MTRLSVLAWIISGLLLPPAAHAEKLPDVTATSTAELRQAMSEVGPGDRRVIRLDGSRLEVPPGESGANPCPPEFARGNAALPSVTGRIVLAGNGSTLAGVGGANLPFCVAPGGDLTLRNLTITGFGDPGARISEDAVLNNSGWSRLDGVTVRRNGSTSGQEGPATESIVTNWDGATMEIVDSVFSENSAISAILRNFEDLVVRNSAFTGNDMADSRQGALYLVRRGKVDIVNTTISGNSFGVFVVASDIIMEHVTVVDNETGISSWGSRDKLLLRNSIVADNRDADCEPRSGLGIAFEGTNLVGDDNCQLDPDTNLVGVDSGLGPLRVLSDGMPGHEPEPASPALDRGDPRFCPFRDAVGRIRNTAADSDERCTLGAIEPPNEPPDFEIDARLTGTWYDPDHDGHYLSVQVLPDNRVAAMWWTYDPDGNPFWLVGSGPVEGGMVRMPVHQSSGMRLPALDDSQRDTQRWGTLELEFEDCHTLTLRWQSSQSGFGTGSSNLQRLTFNEGLHCR